MADRTPTATRRTWEDWVCIWLGVAIALAPWIAEETANKPAVTNAALSGVAVLVLAELDIVAHRRWAEMALIACGAWVAASPFLFGYGGAGGLRAWHIVAGLLVMALGALELRQQREG